jgi:hypothetical protein
MGYRSQEEREYMDVADIFKDLGSVVSGVSEKMDWAEDEIEKAQARHGETGRGPLWGSFRAVRQNENHMAEEIIYRAHAREILDRVAAGRDVRPGTDAEMIAALRASSLVSPLPSAAATLYFRIAARSFPELFATVMAVIDLKAYEAVHGTAADDQESWLRAKLATDRGKD